MLEDMNTLEAAVGGSTEVATILVKAELMESRTLLNLHDLTAAFDDELRRPKAAAGRSTKGCDQASLIAPTTTTRDSHRRYRISAGCSARADVSLGGRRL